VTELDDALMALQTLDATLAQVVELRFYGGYTDDEIGQALGLGERSVRRLWDKARAFLLMQLEQA
jgi:DNA-directed RNA polymerase specialized sigma24 family protein